MYASNFAHFALKNLMKFTSLRFPCHAVLSTYFSAQFQIYLRIRFVCALTHFEMVRFTGYYYYIQF